MPEPFIHRWGRVTCYEGDVRDSVRVMKSKSAQICITSPPYWGLRAYLKGDDARKSMEIGGEPTPDEYISNLVAIFGETRRVLRDDGLLVVNIGDTYSSDDKWGGKSGGKNYTSDEANIPRSRTTSGRPPRSKLMIPYRFAIAMQDDGWILRDEIIWQKPSTMPASVNGWRFEKHRIKVGKSNREMKGHARLDGGRDPSGKNFASAADWIDCPGCKDCADNDGLILRRGSWRTTCDFEPIFIFAKSDSYFADAYAVKEPAASATISRNKYSRILDDSAEQFAVAHDHEFSGVTRNPRSVRLASQENSAGQIMNWLSEHHPEVLDELMSSPNTRSIQSWTGDNYAGSHYAVFPKELAEFFIRAGTSSKGCCAECGSPLARIIEREAANAQIGYAGKNGELDANSSGQRIHANMKAGREAGRDHASPFPKAETIGWRRICKCKTDIPPRPCVVLDVFGGSGVSAEVAIALGCDAVLCELSGEYVQQQKARLTEAMPLFTSAA